MDGVDVVVDGDGSQSIVMIHGWPDTHRLWDRQVEALRQRARCIRFTLPGFEPNARRQVHTLDEIVGLIARVVEATAEGRPVTLLLHDWGCAFGYQFAMRHPRLVARVIGVDIGDAGSKAHVKELGLPAKAMIFGYQAWLALAWRIGGGVGDRMARAMARALRSPADPRDVHAQMGYPYYLVWTGLRGGFRQARVFKPHCPLLYVYARRKPFMFHSSAWAREVEGRPGSRVVSFDAGHWVMVEQPEQFNDAIADWLFAEPAAGLPGPDPRR